MKVVYSLIVTVLLAAPLSAQPIHGHPEKATYASPAEWPKGSSQCHWPGSGLPDTRTLEQKLKDDFILPVFDPRISHTHLTCGFPQDAEIGKDPFDVNCTVTLFHTAGRLGGLWSPLDNIRNMVWAETGTSTPPVMQGDPNSVKEWNVKFTFVPTATRNTFPPTPPNPHGQANMILTLRTDFTGGDRIDLDTLRSYYSVIDPSVPESKTSDEGILNGTRCAPNTLKRPELNPFGNQMGVSVSEYVDKLPLGPIQAKWETKGRFYTYAALEGIDPAKFQFPDGAFQQRFGLDLHGGIPGIIVDSRKLTSQDNQVKIPVSFDPAAMGSGTKKVAQFWRLPDGQGNDVTALYVIDVTVGPGIPDPLPVDVCPNIAGVQTSVPSGLILLNGQCVLPPMPVCTDPAATNVGQPLPCTYPAPIETWNIFSPVFRVNAKDPARLQICRTSDPATCKELTLK